MNIVKLSLFSCAAKQPTAAVESLSQCAWEAIFGSRAYKGSHRIDQDPSLSPPSMRPHFLVLLCSCMSGGTMRQIRGYKQLLEQPLRPAHTLQHM